MQKVGLSQVRDDQWFGGDRTRRDRYGEAVSEAVGNASARSATRSTADGGEFWRDRNRVSIFDLRTLIADHYKRCDLARVRIGGRISRTMAGLSRCIPSRRK